MVFIADDEASAETVPQDADIQYTMRPVLTARLYRCAGPGTTAIPGVPPSMITIRLAVGAVAPTADGGHIGCARKVRSPSAAPP